LNGPVPERTSGIAGELLLEIDERVEHVGRLEGSISLTDRCLLENPCLGESAHVLIRLGKDAHDDDIGACSSEDGSPEDGAWRKGGSRPRVNPETAR
jgi:hypothetical protein